MQFAEVPPAMSVPETTFGAYARYLNDFRPSNRRKLLLAISGMETRDRVFDAIKDYVRTWDRSSQFKDYDIVRMGRWITRDAPLEFRSEVENWALKEDSRGSRALVEGMHMSQAVDA